MYADAFETWKYIYFWGARSLRSLALISYIYISSVGRLGGLAPHPIAKSWLRYWFIGWPDSGNHRQLRNLSESTGPIDGWPDSGKLWWSTIYVRPCSSLRLRCSNAHTWFRANEKKKHNYLYWSPVFRGVSGDFKIQNSLLHVQTLPMDNNWPPMIKFTSTFSFCPNYII